MSKDAMTGLRYAQCWEDADVLLEALDVRAGQTCVSIASAGDNTLALLTRAPRRVIAIDFSPEQIASLELRVSAYRNLRHSELLELIGSIASTRRLDLYRLCRGDLSVAACRFWDAREADIECGIGSIGKFERYLEIFRRRVLPLVHRRSVVARLLEGGTPGERDDFYDRSWDTWRWRLLFRLFFSRFVMSRLGRDPRFFQYADGPVAQRLLERARDGFTVTDPSANPYLQWICSGRHASALPCALRPQHFESIRMHLDRLEWRCCTIEEFLENAEPHSIDRFNLSDIFEYMSPQAYERILTRLLRVGRRGARLVYWNLFADRHRPDSLPRIEPLARLARALHRRDKVFFYGDLVVEEMN